MLNINGKVKLHNRFDIFIENVGDREKRQIAQAENIILTRLLSTALGLTSTSRGFFSYICFGTGTGELSAARTTLFSYLGAKAVVESPGADFSHFNDGYISRTCYCQILETENVGSVLTEVGVGTDSAAINTHAMLKDMNGNPVSITKTNVDIITIYATVYAYFSIPGYDSGHYRPLFDDENSEYSLLRYIVGQYSYLNAGLIRHWFLIWSNPLLAEDSANNDQPANGGYYAFYETGMFSYDGANKKLILANAKRLAAADFNTNGIRAVAFGRSNNSGIKKLGMVFDILGCSAWAGTQITGESIGIGDGVTEDFTTDWGLVKTGWKVYVDSVEQTSGVTVDINKPIINRMDYFMHIVKTSSRGAIVGQNGEQIPISGDWTIFENPYYNTTGLTGVTLGYLKLYCSDDAETWTLVSDRSANAGSTISIDSAYKSKRYWKVEKTNSSSSVCYNFTSTDIGANIHFETAPANEAVITMDYTTAELVKDANHVIDFSASLTFAEYTP